MAETIEQIATISTRLLPPTWDEKQLARAEQRAAQMRAQINSDLAHLRALEEAIHYNKERMEDAKI